MAPVVDLEPPLDDLRDHLVGNEPSLVHVALHAGAELGPVLDVPAEDVADADVNQVKAAGEQPACVPLPLPWGPMITYLRTSGLPLVKYAVSGARVQ